MDTRVGVHPFLPLPLGLFRSPCPVVPAMVSPPHSGEMFPASPPSWVSLPPSPLHGLDGEWVHNDSCFQRRSRGPRPLGQSLVPSRGSASEQSFARSMSIS